MIARIPISLALACVITFGLFWTMQALVSAEGKLQEGSSSPKIDFVRLRKNKAPQEKKREPPKRQKPEQAPPPPDISMSKASLEPSTDFSSVVSDLNVSDGIADGLAGGAGSDRDAVPLVRIEPDYPMRARQRGIEGFVHVAFTISKAGTVKDVEIVKSQPPGTFDKAAITAVSRWKYNPKIVSGVPVERPNQQMWFPFDMDN
jgi:protein TonB